MSEQLEYRVPEMSCEHCRRAIVGALSAVVGVERVDVDLETKAVLVHGGPLNDAELRAAISEVGYAAESV